MSRNKEINNAWFAKAIRSDHLYDERSFREGIEWADKHPKRYSQDELCDIQLEMMRQRDKRLIEKVCEYLETNFGIELCMAFGDKFIDNLRKAMENDK